MFLAPGIVIVTIAIIIAGSALVVGLLNYANKRIFSENKDDRSVGGCMLIFAVSIVSFVIGVVLIGAHFYLKLL